MQYKCKSRQGRFIYQHIREHKYHMIGKYVQ